MKGPKLYQQRRTVNWKWKYFELVFLHISILSFQLILQTLGQLASSLLITLQVAKDEKTAQV